jgi:hypothetical protein
VSEKLKILRKRIAIYPEMSFSKKDLTKILFSNLSPSLAQARLKLHHPGSLYGRAVGSALVGWGTQQADHSGLDCWLTSTPAAHPVYRKCGYSDVDVFDLDLEESGCREAESE